MPMTETLQNLFHEVMIKGSVTLHKKRLLWMLGWGQDRPGAWKDLLAHWERAGTGHELSAAVIWDRVILTMVREPKFEKVAAWAQSDRDVASAEEGAMASAP